MYSKLNKNMELENIDLLHERKSLGQHVFENLRQAIIKGELPPSKRLVENQIAEKLNISRTPVREAIHKLEREGLLEKLPRGGFIVPDLTRENVEETFGIRSVLEGYAARLAATLHQGNELDPFEHKLDEYQRYLESGQMDALLKINTDFHDLLYSLSKSQKLIKMINDLRDQIYQFRRIILSNQELAKKSHEDHRLMMKYIRNRDADGVERLVREHILRGQEGVLKEFSEKDKRYGRK